MQSVLILNCIEVAKSCFWGSAKTIYLVYNSSFRFDVLNEMLNSPEESHQQLPL